MNICEDGHDEVCYETRKCPCCDIIREYLSKIEKLEKEVKDLQNERIASIALALAQGNTIIIKESLKIPDNFKK